MTIKNILDMPFIYRLCVALVLKLPSKTRQKVIYSSLAASIVEKEGNNETMLDKVNRLIDTRGMNSHVVSLGARSRSYFWDGDMRTLPEFTGLLNANSLSESEVDRLVDGIWAKRTKLLMLFLYDTEAKVKLDIRRLVTRARIASNQRNLMAS